MKMSRVLLNSPSLSTTPRSSFFNGIPEFESRVFSNSSNLISHICQFPSFGEKRSSFSNRHVPILNFRDRYQKGSELHQSLQLTLDSRAWASLVTSAMVLMPLVSLMWVVGGGGAGASVLLLTAPAPNYGLSLSLCPSAQLDPGSCEQELFSCCSHTAKYFHLKKGDLKNWLNI